MQRRLAPFAYRTLFRALHVPGRFNGGRTITSRTSQCANFTGQFWNILARKAAIRSG